MVNISALMLDGLELMLLGMSTVFLFLGLLVISMHITARLVEAIEKRQASDSPVGEENSESSPISSELIAAITLAVHRYRNTHNR